MAAVLSRRTVQRLIRVTSMSADFAVLEAEASKDAARRERAPRIVRRLPVGAEPQPGGGVHFRIWAPRVREIAVEIEGARPMPLEAEAAGYYSGLVAEARPGMRYGFRTDTLDKLLPDPVSRFQPEGPHGPSEIIDPGTFRWTDQGWRGRKREDLVVYEMHVGSFTQEGSWEAASRELPELAALGVTCVELMPVADFPGRFGWGYDGVDLFAPTRLYGRPDDFRRFVDCAHAHGIAVILDVVYNHFGPDGNYVDCFSRSYHHRPLRKRMGRPDQFRRPRQLAGARVLSRQRRLLDRGVPSRRSQARRDAADLRRVRRPHHGRHRAAGARGGGRSRHLCRRRERAAARPSGASAGARRLRARCVVERRSPP